MWHFRGSKHTLLPLHIFSWSRRPNPHRISAHGHNDPACRPDSIDGGEIQLFSTVHTVLYMNTHKCNARRRIETDRQSRLFIERETERERLIIIVSSSSSSSQGTDDGEHIIQWWVNDCPFSGCSGEQQCWHAATRAAGGKLAITPRARSPIITGRYNVLRYMEQLSLPASPSTRNVNMPASHTTTRSNTDCPSMSTHSYSVPSFPGMEQRWTCSGMIADLHMSTETSHHTACTTSL